MKFFKNQIFCMDNLDILKSMPDNIVDMIYLDPPFFSQKKHILTDKDGIEHGFNDSWNSINHYIDFLQVRIIECHRILKPTGVLFFHCDKFASHYIRLMLDQIFNYDNFVNEIIWTYKRWTNTKKGLQNNHQNIFMYGKTKNYTFHTKYHEYSPSTNIDQILLNRTRNNINKSIYSAEIAMEKRGVPLSDVWNIPFLNPKAKERVNYPTQKPIELLERLIEISTNQNDILLDPFCGSGSTLVAAKLLNRNYIGIDHSLAAIQLTNYRLETPIKTSSMVLKNGIESYIQKADKLDILSKIKAQPIYRNQSADGILNTAYGLVAVKIQQKNESISTAIQKVSYFTKRKNLNYSVVVRIEGHELFPSEVPPSTIVIDIDNLSKIMDIVTKYIVESKICTL